VAQPQVQTTVAHCGFEGTTSVVTRSLIRSRRWKPSAGSACLRVRWLPSCRFCIARDCRTRPVALPITGETGERGLDGRVHRGAVEPALLFRLAPQAAPAYAMHRCTAQSDPARPLESAFGVAASVRRRVCRAFALRPCATACWAGANVCSYVLFASARDPGPRGIRASCSLRLRAVHVYLAGTIHLPL